MQAPRVMILRALVASGSLLFLLNACPAQQSNPGIGGASPGNSVLVSDEPRQPEYDANIEQTARIIGVESDVAKLNSLASARGASAAVVPTLEELMLRQRITESVMAASFDIDAVVSELNYERDQTVELRSLLRLKRDRAIGSTNLAVLAAGTGLGIVSGLLQFSDTTSGAGNMIGFAGGGLSTLFSLRSYRQVHSGKRPNWVLPNMLAAILGEQEERDGHYPADIWSYLESAPAGATASRKERLLAGWAAAGRLGPADSSKSKKRIALLTSTNAADKDISIEILNERAAMLADVADQVSRMKSGLADLLRSLSLH